MKKAIALLITISVVFAMSLLIGIILSTSEKNIQNAGEIERATQKEILFNDIVKILNKYASKIKHDNELDEFLNGIPLFYDDKSKLFINLKIKNLSNKININSLLIGKKTDIHILKLIENICNKYNILYPSFLTDLILDTMDSDVIEREPMSEIALYNIKFTNSKIVDYNHFKKILDYYTKKTKDRSVYKVPWQDIFYFGENKIYKIDCSRLNNLVAELMGFNPDENDYCSKSTPNHKKVILNYNLTTYDKENNYFVLVIINYRLGEYSDRFSFKYNIKKQKVKSIEYF